MPQHVTLGPLQLSMTLLKRSIPGPESVSMTVVVSTPYSSATIENVLCELSDLINFRFRLHRFIQQTDEGVASMHVLMPMFDLAFTATLKNSVHTEIRMSSDFRFERHIYNFESTFEEVSRFVDEFTCSLVSLSLEVAK